MGVIDGRKQRSVSKLLDRGECGRNASTGGVAEADINRVSVLSW